MEQNAALSQARNSYDQLSNRLDSLVSSQKMIATIYMDVAAKNVQYFSDAQAAGDAGQKRHDEGLGANDVVRMHDLAQQEMRSITDAQTQQTVIESGDVRLLGYYSALYGDQAVKQFRADLASRNEARDNSLAEWQRAIGLVNDNITENMHFRYAGNSNSDIITHYTESTRDSNEASRYEKLSDADAQLLASRLSGDVSSVKSRIALLRNQYPELVSEK
jgi:hypothetical protein